METPGSVALFRCEFCFASRHVDPTAQTPTMQRGSPGEGPACVRYHVTGGTLVHRGWVFHKSHMAVGQNQWYHFGVILDYFRADWDR